jgi:hypothetical protein
MSDYVPDNFVILKLVNKGEVIYKVLAGWFGGFAGSNSWRINSGITKFEKEDDVYFFHGHTGSTYICHETKERMSMLMSSTLASFVEQAKDVAGVSVEVITLEDFVKEFDNN